MRKARRVGDSVEFFSVKRSEDSIARCDIAILVLDAEAGILEHMNSDHAHTLRDYCRLRDLRDVKAAEMIGADCDGFDLNADGQYLRFDFDEPVVSAEALRTAMIALAQKARAA